MPLPDELTDDSLDRLDSFLISDRVADDCMELSTLDGFLTAVAIGPELVKPSEWWPKVWGDQEPEWSTPKEAEEIFQIIVMRYNEILRTVSAGESFFDPLFLESADGEIVVADDWAIGFMAGVSLRRAAWEPLFAATKQFAYIAPIVALSIDDLEIHDTEDEAILELRDAAPDLIAASVINIDRFWKKARGHDGQKAKPGRNDACSCGSGKKYKKCCGSSS